MVHDNSGCNISKIISFESNAKVDDDRWPDVAEEIIIKSEVGSSACNLPLRIPYKCGFNESWTISLGLQLNPRYVQICATGADLTIDENTVSSCFGETFPLWSSSGEDRTTALSSVAIVRVCEAAIEQLNNQTSQPMAWNNTRFGLEAVQVLREYGRDVIIRMRLHEDRDEKAMIHLSTNVRENVYGERAKQLND
ncbi:hypothetical protein V9T40_004913 [Parthenolecanium corni]|uniref:Uncharacterized protein n=1 Tax=Parthenolecanium corni TaxID=536013 RepID=A0AAN9Y3J2_9HEMI